MLAHVEMEPESS